MYIPPFVCGIIFTVAAEIVIAVIYSIYSDKKRQKRREGGEGDL